MLNILLPMAGEGQRFKDAGYDVPKPLIDVFGKPMYQRVLDSLKPNEPSNIILIAREEHNIPPTDSCHIIEINEKTEGAVCTVLLAKGHFNDERPLLIANCDQLLTININDFLEQAQNYDASVITFNSTNPHHSYVKNHGDLVIEVAEKKVISDKAVAGIYWYKYGSEFIRKATDMINKNIRINNEFYISPVFNEYIADNKRVGFYDIDVRQKHILGTPEELQIFIDKVNEGEVTL